MPRSIMAWVYDLLIAMDSDHAYIYLQMQADKDDELDKEEKCVAIVLILILALGVEEAKQTLSHCRHPSFLYLCRPQLLPHPWGQTRWQILFSSHCDRAYITTMGFDVKDFQSHPWSGVLSQMEQHCHPLEQHKPCRCSLTLQLLSQCGWSFGSCPTLSQFDYAGDQSPASLCTHSSLHLSIHYIFPENFDRTPSIHPRGPHLLAKWLANYP